MDHKENNKQHRVKDAKEKTEAIEIQIHKGDEPDTKHDDE